MQKNDTKNDNMRLMPTALALLGLSLLRFVFLSDIPFINDEPLLFLQALRENETRVLTTHGLLGSRGVDYGPFAIWFYRSALFFTHHILWIAALKILFVSALTIISLLLIARTFPSLPPSYSLLALLSPYLWFYARDLWDNSFVIPLSGFALASYLDFIRRQHFFSLALSFLALSCGFLTHLVFLPILIGVGLHFIYFRPLPFSIKQWGQLFLLFILPALPYLFHLFGQNPAQKLAPGDIGHFVMPFTGARFFTGFGLEYFLGTQWYQPFGNVWDAVWKGMLGISLISYPLLAYGVWDAARTLWKNPEVEEKPLLWLLLFCFFAQCLLSWAYQLIPIPNFHSSLWLVNFIFIWRVLNRKWLKPIFWGVSTSLVLALIGMTSVIHYYGGNRELHYGPTLGNLQSLVKITSLNEGTHHQTLHTSRFPWSLEALAKLEDKVTTPSQIFRLVYETPENPRSGKIIAVPLNTHLSKRASP